MDNYFVIYELKAIGAILSAMGTNENVGDIKDLHHALNFIGSLVSERAEALEDNELEKVPSQKQFE